LIESVEPEHLDTGEGIEALSGKSLPEFGRATFGARVAIAKRVVERAAIVAQANVVNGPAIDSDGVDSVIGSGCAFLQTGVELFSNVLEIPEKMAVPLNG
jgi:hypothetical protein